MARYGIWSPIPQSVWTRRKWSVGRNGRRITAVVIHRMDGSLEGSDSWLKGFWSGSASTHFGVGLWNGVPQIRQWVDTINTAWGWGARPTDTPTTLARNTLTNLWVGSEDLNWQVIAVEVEGFANQPWDSRTKAKVQELLRWIWRTHGNLTVMAHTDCSIKPCPGMATFNAALPGYYGNKLNNIFGVSSVNAPPPALTKVGGLPVDFVSRAGWKATIKDNKPRRAGATLASKNYGTTDRPHAFPIWGEVNGQRFEGNGGDRWFFGPQYIGGWRVVYIPLFDLKDENFL